MGDDKYCQHHSQHRKDINDLETGQETIHKLLKWKVDWRVFAGAMTIFFALLSIVYATVSSTDKAVTINTEHRKFIEQEIKEINQHLKRIAENQCKP